MYVHPEYRRAVEGAALWFAAGLLSIAAFAYVPTLQYRLPPELNAAFHTLVETASIVVSGLVFALGSRKATRTRSGSIAVVSSAFLAVAVLDFVHVLSFEGMPAFVTPSGRGKAISFFIAARLIVALAMLAIALMPWRRRYSRYRHAITAVTLLVAAGVSVGGFLPGAKELFMRPGVGLTPLKVVSEYLIIALYAAAAVGFARRCRELQPFAVDDFLKASILMAVSEACFTIYMASTDPINNLGHVWKIVAYLFVYRAVLDYVVERPYAQLQRARAELFESAERLTLIFRNSVDGVLVFDHEARIAAANPAARLLVAATPSQLLQTDASEWVVASTPALPRVFAQLRRTGRAAAQMRLRRTDGTMFQADVRIASYADSVGRRIASCVIHDVTERERARQEILDLNATLEVRVLERTAALKLANEELEAFSYSIAHDLIAPLAAINGFCSALPESEGVPLTRRHIHYLERVRANSQRMAEMIDAILHLSRLSRAPLRRVEVDLAALVDTVVDNLRRIEPERNVRWTIERPLIACGDPTLASTVLENLVGNAWKFTAKRAEGRIWIGTRRDDDGSPVFFVRDNGEGFDVATAQRLFGLFCRFHSDPEFPGHGIGLANVRRIITMHGGRIWAESAPSQGATFYFTFAQSGAEPAAPPAGRRERAPAELSS